MFLSEDYRVVVPVSGKETACLNTLSTERLARAKVSYATRRFDRANAKTLLSGALAPQAGDLVLAKVKRLGQHQRIELGSGRRAHLHIGDEVVVCYGNRYAPDQFEALVPEDLGECHLVAAGGIAAHMQSKHSRMKNPTRLEPIGLIGDDRGRRLNLSHTRIPRSTGDGTLPCTLAVVGTAMNAGKTTCASHLIKGLDHRGLRVGAAKITGTGAGGDVWSMTDSGAEHVVDFTDAGFASTFRLGGDELEDILITLTTYLAEQSVDVIVFEVADGVCQEETASILDSPIFKRLVDWVIFTAGDAMGAVSGVRWLQARGLPLAALSGAMTASPLATREAARETGMPVLNLTQLADPLVADQLLMGDLSKAQCNAT